MSGSLGHGAAGVRRNGRSALNGRSGRIGEAPGPGGRDLASIEGERLERALAKRSAEDLPRLQRLWAYYRNPELGSTDSGAEWARGLETREDHAGAVRWRGGRRRTAQELGLPARLRGVSPYESLHGAAHAALGDDRDATREVVIENDIGWRVDTMIDFLFGNPIRLVSLRADDADQDGNKGAERRALIERVLESVWEASGGPALLQDMALLGHVYGFVDLVLRWDEALLLAAGEAGLTDTESIAEAAGAALRIEVVEPTRAAPVVSAWDYRRLEAYAIASERESEASGGSSRGGVWRLLGVSPRSAAESRTSEVVEVLRVGGRRVYVDGVLAHESSGVIEGALGRVPVVHVQNLTQPFRYAGVSEVEQLVPLQDELNTRLSDRASRVTLQSFKMYLAKGLDGFAEGRVGPGQVWSTDNPDASIESFGGDAQSPSEASHINEVREAMDKVSGVPPLAGGVIRARIGNLSSATALRITLMGLLAKTARKRVTYGGGIAAMSRLALGALDAAGVLKTAPSERSVRVAWPDPVPADVRERIAAAMAKRDLGVPDERVLAELGESAADPGIG